MLVVTRKRGEEIVVEGGIVFTVLEVQGDRVRVGVTAPKNLAVDRREIWERKKQTKAAIATTTTTTSEGVKPCDAPQPS